MSRNPLASLAAASTLIASLGLACGSSPEDVGAVEDYPIVPALPAGSVAYEFPELTIPAGSDVQHCLFLEKTTEDMYVKAFRSYQGKSGHHILLLAAVVTDDPGTVRDCSSAEDMVRFRPVVSSERFGYDQFPEGMAVKVRAGTQLVVQQHYVNTTEHEIRVKDVAHMTPVPESEVETLVGFMGLSDITFEMPASPDVQTMTFDCQIPFDAKLLVMGPHMHDLGVTFRTEMGPAAGPLETKIDIPVWSAEYRDKPPLLKYTKDNAPDLKAGDIVRTTCGFKNTRDDSLTFPEEMCATFGYYFPAVDGQEEIICAGDEI